MRFAGTAFLLLASWLALPLSANAVPILFDYGTPPGLANAPGLANRPGLANAPGLANGPGLANAPGLAPVLTSVVVIPEPGALSILVLGLGLLLVARKNKAITHHH